MPATTIQIPGEEQPTAHETIQNCDAAGWDCAILIGGKYVNVMKETADEIAASGRYFAYLFHHEPTGRIMTVPING
jgi:hypothetical protein